MKTKALRALAGAALLAVPALAAAPTVKATNAWCRAAPAGALTGGCYVTLTAADDDRLAAVTTPSADHGEIHTMDMTGGVMRMRQLADGVVLPAGQAVELKPGGRHLMIIGPKQALSAGGVVPLTLKFEKAPPLTLRVPVRAAGAMGGR